MKEHRHPSIPSFTARSAERPDRFFQALEAADARLEQEADRAQRNAELEWEIRHDAMTGLLNRRGLKESAMFMADNLVAAQPGGEYIDDVRGLPTKLAILAFDLDGFKAINDSYGHATGDRALKEFAMILSGALREGDAVGRFGGDEFAAALPITESGGITEDDVYAAIRDVLDLTLDSWRDYLHDHELDAVHMRKLGTSFGVAMYDPAADGPFDFDTVHHQADEAARADKRHRKAGR